MNQIAALARLEKLIVPRTRPENELMEMLVLGIYVALLAPMRCGRSTVLRNLRTRFEYEQPDGLFVLLRPDQAPDLSRAVFLNDLLAKLHSQLRARHLPLPPSHSDPYLALKSTFTALPELVAGPVVVAIDELGRLDVKLLHTLLWIFRELHSMRADEGWNGPLSRLAVIVGGSRRLFELTIGEEDHTLSPFNVAELYHLPDLYGQEVETLTRRAVSEGLITLQQEVETLSTLRRFADGHPALLKGLLAEVMQEGGRLNPATVHEAAMRALQHDRTLTTLWERLCQEPTSLALARQIFLEGTRPPARIELASEPLRLLFWLGLVVDHNGGYAPRCDLIEAYFRTRLEELALQGGGTTENNSPSAGSATPHGSGTTLHPTGHSTGHAPATGNPSALTPRVSGSFVLPNTGAVSPRRTGEIRVIADPTAPVRTGPTFTDAQFPDGLVRGFRQHEGVLFVGAGASRAAGMPSWAELTEAMKGRILATARSTEERQNLEGFLSSNDAPAAAQLMRDQLGPYEYHQFLVEFLRRPARLAPVHQAFKRLPARVVITTNYDKLLERTFRGPDDTDPLVLFTPAQLGSIQEMQQLTVVKMHGDIDHPETIVLTSDDYRGYFDRRKGLRNFVEHQFGFRTVLFVGFSLKDPNFDLIYEEAHATLLGRGRPAYALMVGNNPFESAQWRARGIHIIDLSGYDEVSAWVEALADRIAARDS